MAFLRLEYLSNARLIYLLLNFIKIYVEIIEKVRPKSLVGGLYIFLIFLLYVTEFDGQTLTMTKNGPKLLIHL
jgi:hypothetical protein